MPLLAERVIMIRIIVDSTSDISFEEAKKIGVDIVPITVRFGDEEFTDGIDITHKEFYDRLSVCEELPKTSQPSPAVFSELFTRYVKAGDDVIGIFISSGFSGTYQCAKLAADDVEDELNVTGKIHIIDSKSVSVGINLMVREAKKLIAEGKSAESIAEELTKMADHIKLRAIVGSLKYLKMGGRLTSVEAFAGSLLHITPIVEIVDGKVEVIGKTRGKKAADNQLQSLLEGKNISPSRDVMFFHINCQDLLEPFIDKCISSFNNLKVSADSYSLGCAVGTHVGPGTYGYAYIENYS